MSLWLRWASALTSRTSSRVHQGKGWLPQVRSVSILSWRAVSISKVKRYRLSCLAAVFA